MNINADIFMYILKNVPYFSLGITVANLVLYPRYRCYILCRNAFVSGTPAEMLLRSIDCEKNCFLKYVYSGLCSRILLVVIGSTIQDNLELEHKSPD